MILTELSNAKMCQINKSCACKLHASSKNSSSSFQILVLSNQIDDKENV